MGATSILLITLFYLGIFLGFIALLIYVISNRLKERKNETFEKRKY